MNKLFGYLRDFARENFSRAEYSYVAAFVSLLIFLNFYFGFEDYIAEAHFGTATYIALFAAMYTVAYYGTIIPMLAIGGRLNKLHNAEFWWKSAFLVGVVTIRRASYLHWEWAPLLAGSPDDEMFLRFVLVNANRVIFTLIALGLLKLLWDKSRVEGLYGIHFANLDLKPYFWMFIAMLPLIALASFQPDFLVDYPRFKPWLVPNAFNLSDAGMAGVFEVFYALNFVTVELVFRGALVIGMAHLLGKDCILPMVVLYCSLHFGKPLGEAISSIFGGYILGVIALYSRNIWGGILVHIGIALGMEGAAWLQHGSQQ